METKEPRQRGTASSRSLATRKWYLIAATVLAALFTVDALWLGRPRDALNTVEAWTEREPGSVAAWNQLADAHLQRLSSHGDLDHLRKATEAVERSLLIVPPAKNRGGLAMRIRVELAAHRFSEARASAEQLRELMPGSPYPLRFLGDALFQLGDYEGARSAWDQLATGGDPPLAIEPRLAQLDYVHGRNVQARERLERSVQLAREAEPPQPGTLRSCHLRLGEAAFRAGDWDSAEEHYLAAGRISPDDYRVLERLAELRGAQERFPEAVLLYQKLIRRTGRPELLQALGDLYAFQGDARSAQPWHDRAEAEYQAGIARGEIGHFHHLSGFYADSRPQPEQALKWARQDLELRQSIHAYDALAWALYRSGRHAEALAALERATATGTRDPHILHHAGMIRASAGDLAGSRDALLQAAQANPRYRAFHVHR